MAANSDPPSIDVEREVTFTRDIQGSSLLVRWRGVPVGYVRPIRRAPRGNSRLSDEARAEIRAIYRPLIGKWTSDQLSEVCDSREQAAELLIVQQIAKSDRSPLMQAALRNDLDEVSRLLSQVAPGNLRSDGNGSID